MKILYLACILWKHQTVTLTWWITSSEEHIEELFRRNIWLKVSAVWAVTGRMSPFFFASIVLSPFVNIAQNSVRTANGWVKIWKCFKMLPVRMILASEEFTWCCTFKCFCCTWSVILVRVEFQSKFPVWSLQLVLWGIFLDPENFIEVFALFYPVQREHINANFNHSRQ